MDTGNTEVKALIAAQTPPHSTCYIRSPKSQLIIQTVCEQCGCVAVTIVISFSFPDHRVASPHTCLKESVLLPRLTSLHESHKSRLPYQQRIKPFDFSFLFPPQ